MTVLVPKVAGVEHRARLHAAARRRRRAIRRCSTPPTCAAPTACYSLGGVQAMAAMAFGLEGEAPVDMIVGAGNAYVTEAKRQLFGRVGIDLLAGPSEITVIADDDADAELVAADLLGQAEHGPTSPVGADLPLGGVRPARDRGGRAPAGRARTTTTARAAWTDYGSVIVAADREEAAQVSDAVAPEHLEVHAADEDWWLDRLRNYGSLFLGALTTVAFSDKGTTGTNHVLPTGRAATLLGRAVGAALHQDADLPAHHGPRGVAAAGRGRRGDLGGRGAAGPRRDRHPAAGASAQRGDPAMTIAPPRHADRAACTGSCRWSTPPRSRSGLIGPVGAIALLGTGAAGIIGRGVTLSFIFAVIGVALVGYAFVKLSQHISHTGSVYALCRRHARPAGGLLRRLGAVRRLHRDRHRLDDRDRAVRRPVPVRHGDRARQRVRVGGADRAGARVRAGVQRDPADHPHAARLGADRRRAGDDPQPRHARHGDLQPRPAGADVQPGTSWRCRTGAGIGTIASAAVYGFLAFAGFEGAAALGEETDNPKHEIPRAIKVAIVVVGAFYLLTAAAQSLGYGTDGRGREGVRGRLPVRRPRQGLHRLGLRRPADPDGDRSA